MHSHENQDLRRELMLLGLCAVLLAAVWAVTAIFEREWLRAALFLIPYLIAGFPVLKEAAEKLTHRELLEEDFLMAVASIGALCIGEYPEAVAVMLFYRVGEAFEEYAVGKSRRSISALMDIRPEWANIEQDSEMLRVPPESVAVGTVITVRPGEKIPLDGVITEGESSVDTSALTGEALPRDLSAGQQVFSGFVNINGLLRVRVTSGYKDSAVAKILRLTESSAENKSRREALITRFARIYTPSVVGCALLLALIPPLLFSAEFSEWLRRALIFLVVSCPCALVVSVPLSFFGGIGGASRRGILIKGSSYLEALAEVSVVALDKTGTVTQGSFSVSGAYPVGISPDELIRLAAAAESYSNHPIAQSLKNACTDMIPSSDIGAVHEIPGRGVSASVAGTSVLVGNAAFMQAEGIDFAVSGSGSAVVYVAADGKFIGHIVISDSIKDGAKDAIKELHGLGAAKVVMLTGDSEAVGRAVGEAIGTDSVKAELLPADKVAAVSELLLEKQGGTLLFVGDGVNDAPVLALSDVGAAMGALGSDAAIEAADVVLMDDDIRKLPLAVRIARRTVKIAKQNIWLALTVKFAIMILGAAGIVGMWPAVFADVGVLILAVLNASRTLKGNAK